MIIVMIYQKFALGTEFFKIKKKASFEFYFQSFMTVSTAFSFLQYDTLYTKTPGREISFFFFPCIRPSIMYNS